MWPYLQSLINMYLSFCVSRHFMTCWKNFPDLRTWFFCLKWFFYDSLFLKDEHIFISKIKIVLEVEKTDVGIFNVFPFLFLSKFYRFGQCLWLFATNYLPLKGCVQFHPLLPFLFCFFQVEEEISNLACRQVDHIKGGWFLCFHSTKAHLKPLIKFAKTKLN